MKTDIRAVIVEDMESYMLTIEKMVTEVAPYVTIIGKTTSLRNAKTLISDWSPNLLLMDIQFEEEGLTAFDLLSQLGRKEELSFDIIFITGHRASEYYSMAFDYGALHFLKKPVDKQKLKEAIERIHDKNTEGYINDWINQVSQLQLRLQSERFPSKIIIEGINFNEMADVKDIVILEASGRYTELTFSGGKKFISCHNIGEFEKKLESYNCFFRIHHSKIINLNYIRRFSKKERIFELVPPHGNHIASKERFRDLMKYLETNKFVL